MSKLKKFVRFDDYLRERLKDPEFRELFLKAQAKLKREIEKIETAKRNKKRERERGK